MNQRVTQFADGFARRAFTVAEVERMLEAGIIDEDENFELIEGEIVPMAAKNHVHERVKSALVATLIRQLPDALWLGIETTIRLGFLTYFEPDISIYPKPMHLLDVRGPDVLLAVEVSDSSFVFDRGRKAQLYASYGFRELWVVEANSRTTYVHTDATTSGWGSVTEVSAASLLRPSMSELSKVSFRLADLD